VRAWAASSEVAARADESNRRLLGELRLPLSRIAGLGLNMLYQTWITLDSPGVSDSLTTGASDLDRAFDQKLIDGPRQLYQPKVCQSLCSMEHLNPAGKLVLAPDVSNERREEQWSALLRSQQQHVVMSSALHKQALKVSEMSSSGGQLAAANETRPTAQQIQEALRRVQEQAIHIEELRSKLQRVRSGSPMDTASRQEGSLQRARVIQEETEQLHSRNRELEADVEQVRSNLDQVSEEANGKIDSANDRIRSLRLERDEALKEGDRMRAEGERLYHRQEECRKERQQLSDQKEALLRIVEDLHQSCLTAGMETAGRHSVKDLGEMTANFRRSA